MPERQQAAALQVPAQRRRRGLTALRSLAECGGLPPLLDCGSLLPGVNCAVASHRSARAAASCRTPGACKKSPAEAGLGEEAGERTYQAGRRRSLSCLRPRFAALLTLYW